MALAEIHIAGLLVLAAPTAVSSVARWLKTQPVAELRAQHGERLVVIAEADSMDGVLSFIEQLRGLAGVLDVALTYQHSEPSEAMEELIDADQPA